MAKHNPFSVFRRNQKAWLAGLTLFTMFSFIVLGNMFQCVQQRQPVGANPANFYAKTTTYGNLDHNKYENFRNGLNGFQMFLQTVVQLLAADQAIVPYANMLLVIEKDPSDPTKQYPVLLDNLMGLMEEMNVVLSDPKRVGDRWLLVQTAQSKGFKADEASVKEYLSLLFQNKMTQQDFERAMAQSGLRQGNVIEIVGNQIIVERLFRSVAGGRRWTGSNESPLPFGLGNIASAPGEHIDALQRIYRKIRTDVASFPVEKYVSQVTAPTDEVLKDFYHQYRFVTRNPAAKDPGFSLPNRLAFEVVRAKLTPERIAAIPAAEVKAYYEKHKEDYKKPAAQQNSPAPVKSDSLNLTPGSGPALTPIPDQIISDVAPADAKKADAKKADAKKADAPKADAKPVAKPADAPKADAKPAETKKAEPAKSSAVEPKSPFRLVSYEAEKTTVAAKPADAPKANAKPAAKPADAPKADAKPAAKPADAPKADAKPATKPAETKKADDGYFPFELVEQDIRRKLASEKLEAEMAKLQDDMTAYAKARSRNRTKGNEVKPFALSELAAKSGFDFIETSKMENGKKVPMIVYQAEAENLEVLPRSIIAECFQSVPAEYSPVNTGLIVDSVYLYWVTKSLVAENPEFDACKDLVLESWKKTEAAKLAMKDAQAFADKVKASGKKLADVVKAETTPVEFASTQKFSWFDFPRGGRNAGLDLGEIREEGVPYGEAQRKNKVIVAPGDGFYETAYNLDENGIGVTFNQPEDRAFVIQVVEKDKDEVILSQIDSMKSDPFARQAYAASVQRVNFEFYENWIKQLQKESGFEWLSIPPKMK